MRLENVWAFIEEQIEQDRLREIAREARREIERALLVQAESQKTREEIALEAGRKLTRALFALQEGHTKEAHCCAARAAELLGRLAPAPEPSFTSWKR
jgi:hypothetical protein